MKRLLLLAVFALGCSSGVSESDVLDIKDDLDRLDATQDTDTEIDYLGREFEVCIPGTPLQCTDDSFGLVVCNAEGNGYRTQSCAPDGVCREDPLGCTSCVPGRRKCLDDFTVLRCDQDSNDWVVAQECDPTNTGKICQLGNCISLCELAEKLNSYIGCEYWAVDLDNAFVPGGGQGGYHDAAGAQYAIVVSNTSSKYGVKVQIDTAYGPVLNDSSGNPFPDDPIPPMGLRIFNLPRAHTIEKEDGTQTQEFWDADGTMLKPIGYRIKSTMPITAYQFNPLENVGVFSNDASILLPTNALGRYHMIMTREQTFPDLKGFLTVIGTFNGPTEVVVQVTAPTLKGKDIPAMQPGETRSFILNRYDVLNIETDAIGADLTGSTVTSNHPVAVFGGSEAANAPNTNHCCPDGSCDYNGHWMECTSRSDCLCEYPKNLGSESKDVSCRNNYDCISYNTCCADHLEMQLFPVQTWGKKYIATQSYPRGGEKDVWRIMAAENNTMVTTSPPVVGNTLLNRGEWIDFESDRNFEIVATKPILVGQFLAAQDAPDPNIGGIGPNDARTGDPSFILAVPVEQFRTEYVFLAPNKYTYDCVSIISKVGVPVYLNGKELKQEDLTFKRIRDIMDDIAKINEEKAEDEPKLVEPTELGPQFGDYHVVGVNQEWAVWRLVIPDGVHTAHSSEPFAVISYGYDRYVSYGYPAGLNLDDLKLISDPK